MWPQGQRVLPETGAQQDQRVHQARLDLLDLLDLPARPDRKVLQEMDLGVEAEYVQGLRQGRSLFILS